MRGGTWELGRGGKSGMDVQLLYLITSVLWEASRDTKSCTRVWWHLGLRETVYGLIWRLEGSCL